MGRKNIKENIFAEFGVDYEVFDIDVENSLVGRPSGDYKLTASFSKKLAMSSQIEKGEKAREYLTNFHSAWMLSAEILECAGIKQVIIAVLAKYHGKFMSPYSIGGVYSGSI